MEVCVDNLESAINAESGGAMRIELCLALSEGGLTPTVGLLKAVKRKVKIPIFVMIRPRGGDFVYSNDEVEIMMEDINILKDNGADGFVTGILTSSGKVDVKNCIKLLKLTEGLPVTFHRAFDKVNSPQESLEEIIALGFQRILTSGLQSSASQGIPLIKELIETAKDRIIIMPGAGVKRDNVSQILKETGAKEFHGSAKVHKGSNYYVTEANIVREMLTIYQSQVEQRSEYSPKPDSHAPTEENQ